MSALATIVGSLGELSESELQQLYLMVGVRLGIPGALSGENPRGRATGKTGKPKPSTQKSGKKATSSKGNPTRKSQWANHPLYQEYSRLKKVVESQAKEAKTSFNAVDTAESRAYRKAFTDWVEAKSSFRDHRETGQKEPKAPRKKEDEEESSSEEEEEPVKPAPPPRKQTKSASPPAAAGPSGKSRGSPAKSAGTS